MKRVLLSLALTAATSIGVAGISATPAFASHGTCYTGSTGNLICAHGYGSSSFGSGGSFTDTPGGGVTIQGGGSNGRGCQ